MITAERFFKCGIAAFAIIGFCGIWGLVANYGILPWYAKVSSSASIFFDIVLIGFFYYNLRNSPPSPLPDMSEKEIMQEMEA
ncbi:MAG: hypothetical protein QME12_09145 [Nanoarchaeota archaeon]|nr:hypothetical protein [Nanoarchaeota archaeon]